MKTIEKPRFSCGFSMILMVRGASKSTKNLKNRARSALEHQRIVRDGQNWPDWLHKWPNWAQWGPKEPPKWSSRSPRPAGPFYHLSEPGPPIDRLLARFEGLEGFWAGPWDLHALRPEASADFPKIFETFQNGPLSGGVFKEFIFSKIA